MIPCSTWAVEAYPTEIRIFRNEESISLQLDLTGPVIGFTLEQDLEKNVVRVFGRALEGYYHFEIYHEFKAVRILLKRGKLIPYQFGSKKGVLEKHQYLEIPTDAAFLQNHTERLSLGISKKLDWENVSRRVDLKEILPVLFFLGQKAGPYGSDLEIQVLDESFIKHQFTSILLPKRTWDKRLGITKIDIPNHVMLSEILYKSYEAIRSLFIKEENGQILINTACFVSGRMTGVKTTQAIFDIEWTKRKIRKIRITALEEGILHIKWPKDVDSFRLKHRAQEKGKMISRLDEILVVPGQIIYLDKFQK